MSSSNTTKVSYRVSKPISGLLHRLFTTHVSHAEKQNNARHLLFKEAVRRQLTGNFALDTAQFKSLDHRYNSETENLVINPTSRSWLLALDQQKVLSNERRVGDEPFMILMSLIDKIRRKLPDALVKGRHDVAQPTSKAKYKEALFECLTSRLTALTEMIASSKAFSEITHIASNSGSDGQGRFSIHMDSTINLIRLAFPELHDNHFIGGVERIRLSVERYCNENSGDKIDQIRSALSEFSEGPCDDTFNYLTAKLRCPRFSYADQLRSLKKRVSCSVLLSGKKPGDQVAQEINSIWEQLKGEVMDSFTAFDAQLKAAYLIYHAYSQFEKARLGSDYCQETSKRARMFGCFPLRSSVFKDNSWLTPQETEVSVS